MSPEPLKKGEKQKAVKYKERGANEQVQCPSGASPPTAALLSLSVLTTHALSSLGLVHSDDARYTQHWPKNSPAVTPTH